LNTPKISEPPIYSDTSRPFARPSGGRIAVKVINHFGDEVMKAFGV
jgi:adenine-specific DNA-methyltransferase